MVDLYERFKKALHMQDINSLGEFERKEFWTTLSEQEKFDLACLFLAKAESYCYHSENSSIFFHALSTAEEIASAHPEVLCESASLLCKFGLSQRKASHFIESLEKLFLCQKKSSNFVHSSARYLHLWGNILVAISCFISDPSLLENALEKYGEAKKNLQNHDPLEMQLFWDAAKAWCLLYTQSKEISDLYKSLEYYAKTKKKVPHLKIDHAETLILLALHKGHPAFLEDALTLLREVIADTYNFENLLPAYNRAWIRYAYAAKCRFELTHRKHHLESAHLIFREAILNAENKTDLWIQWGELFLHSAMICGNTQDLENGLEKLTSSKIRECNFLMISALLGIGLALFGHILEDLNLMYEGRTRIMMAHSIVPSHSKLCFAHAMTELCIAHYFSDINAYAKTASLFEKNLKNDPSSVENLYGYFQTLRTIGLSKKDCLILKIAIGAIARVCELRPFSFIYLNEWGNTLAKIAEHEPRDEVSIAYLEEALMILERAFALSDNVDILFNIGCTLDNLAELNGNEKDYERALEIFVKVLERKPSCQRGSYYFALTLSHLGELLGDIDNLMHATCYFESVVKVYAEDYNFWCQYGYTLLNLSELIYDPYLPDRGKDLRHEAEIKLMRAVELGSDMACYHLACLYSLAGLNSQSIYFLQKAEELGCLPDPDDLEHDEWLAHVRKTEAFREFLTTLKQDSV